MSKDLDALTNEVLASSALLAVTAASKFYIAVFKADFIILF